MDEISAEMFEVVKNTIGEPIITDGDVLLQNRNNGELLYVPFNDDVKNIFNVRNVSPDLPEHEETSENEEDQNHTNKLWNRTTILFLIEQIENAEKQFEREVKRNVWIQIAKQCSKQFGKNLDYKQCDSKWKSLKRTCKGIHLHNQQTGNKRRQWEFLSAIHKFMYKKPEITPSATCSSRKGLQCAEGATCSSRREPQQSQHVEQESNFERESEVEEGGSSEATNTNEFESSFTKKRKPRMSMAERRHSDKMARQDRFNDLFEKLLEKL